MILTINDGANNTVITRTMHISAQRIILQLCIDTWNAVSVYQN